MLLKVILLLDVRTAWALSAPTPAQPNRLFMDQQEAMARQAEHEESMLGRCGELVVPMKVKTAGTKVKRGSGFGSSGPSTAEKETKARSRVLMKEGVLKIEGGLTRETALKLREAVLAEIDDARDIVRDRPQMSMSLFHAREEQQLRSFVLLPLRRRRDSDDAIVQATRELLGPDAPLGQLYEKLCGPEAVLYDFYGLRTEPGSFRQPIHFDTPFQEVPPLYASFIALQDVTMAMGPTHFLPGTHIQTPKRLDFDGGLFDGRRDAMLNDIEPKFALLKAGDLVIFDMRVLHFGAANTGSTRLFLNLTFRNPKAKASNLGHIPCIRPGFIDAFTLSDIQYQLQSDDPFSAFGDGLPRDP